MEAWRKQKETVVYDRFRRILSRTFELPNGDIADFEILDLRDSVAVLALTPSNEVLLVEEFVPGPKPSSSSYPAASSSPVRLRSTRRGQSSSRRPGTKATWSRSAP